MSKFKAKTFKTWLDALARTVVKTRDDWACQYDDCEGSCGGVDWHHIRYRTLNHLRWDLLNGISLCSSCHRKWHNGPKLAVWFEQKYPDRYKWVYSKPRLEGTWKEDDFLAVEKFLIGKCVDLNVDPYRMSEAHAKRLVKKIEAL